MIESNKDLESISSKSDYYKSIRNEITVLLKKINSSFENNSSTYYLSLFYADKIFNMTDFNKYIENYYRYEFQINSNIKKIYIILSVCCLIISTKFNENDPHFPGAYNFLELSNQFTNFNYNIQINDLVEGEIIILKLLKYKLNYYSVYNYLVFFFGHGIILETTLEKIKMKKKIDKKMILEKIYILSREILDLLNNENSKESIDILVKNNHVTSIIILSYSIEKILVIDINKISTNIFKEYYGIKIENDRKELIYNIIKKLYVNIEKKNKNKSIGYTYSTALFNNRKIQSNIFPKDENINNINKNNKNNILDTNNNLDTFSQMRNKKKVSINYQKDKDELNNNNIYENKAYKNELRKSLSMNQLKNKTSSTDINFIYSQEIQNPKNIYNLNSNNNYLNYNKIDNHKRNIFIFSENINNFNNYYIDEISNNKNKNNNKKISFKKNISFNNQINKINNDIYSYNKIDYYYDNKYKPNNQYYLKNMSLQSEPMTTKNKRLKLMQKNKNFNNLNLDLNLGNNNKSKEELYLYNMIEKTKKIFNMNNNSNEKEKSNNNFYKINNYSNYYNQDNKRKNITNNYYNKLNIKENNNKYYDEKYLNPKNYMDYKINYNNEEDKYYNNYKTNRQKLNFLKNENKYMNTYFDYSSDLNINDNYNKNNLNSFRRYSYYKQSHDYYN